MCFIKHVKSLDKLPTLHPTDQKYQHEDSPYQTASENDFIYNPQKYEFLPSKLDSNLFMLNCINLMQMNANLMLHMDVKLSCAEQMLIESDLHIDQDNLKRTLPEENRMVDSNSDLRSRDLQNYVQTTEPLVKKLFGQSHYRYQLQLDGEFPETLYKQRNFKCSVKLIDCLSGKQTFNGNMLNICLGLCNADGEWIQQTREGAAFIKGKVQTELIHGSAQFVKLAPRDVSRSFSNKSLNIIIYAKSSLLQYSGESSLEQSIRSDLIAPLVIKDVTIKAKKRD